jgi:DNA-binding transcriptional MerR regulator
MAPAASERRDLDGSDGSEGVWRERRMTIGRVIEHLRADFPDVSPSKIRFLEAEGLVTPERTPAGYRTYTAGDVERLHYVLAAQRDKYWPLKVIREALDADDNVVPAATPPAVTPPAVTPPGVTPAEAEVTPRDRRDRRALTAAELRDEAGLSRGLLASLEDFGMVRADRFGRFDSQALAVARAASRLADHGLEPRHLRAFRAAADREVGLVEQVVATRRGDDSREQRAAEVAAACIELHTALVRAGLRRGTVDR